ncbi:MAG: hypothetical protein RSA53_10480 [Odoribacter sp.]
MSITYELFNQGLRKSTGNVTFCMLKGQTISKLKIAKNPSKQPSQQIQRAIISSLGELSSTLISGIRLGFPQHRRTQSMTNVFIQKNKTNVVVEVISGRYVPDIDYPRILCAFGNEYPPNIKAELDAAKTHLTFTIGASYDGCMSYPDDEIYAVLLCADSEKPLCLTRKMGDRTQTGTQTMEIPEGWDVKKLYIYSFTRSYKHKRASRSICIYSPQTGG